jgi:hypothetical protein
LNQIAQLLQELHEPPATVRGRRRTYVLLRPLAAGDAADVHLATAAYDPETSPEPFYLLKASRISDGDALLHNERRALAVLRGAAADTTYRKYLPALDESFSTSTGRVNVFLHEPGFYTLEQVHERHAALDGRHLAWIFKRLLTVLGFAHRQGIVHGAALPCHVTLHAENHGLQLIGWGQCVALGQALQVVPTRYRDWYPPEVLKKRPASAATDLFLAARCMVYLAGGDPLRDRIPDTIPAPVRQFLKGCLLPGPHMRPDDAWAVLDEFDELLAQLYGPPQFHPLIMT